MPASFTVDECRNFLRRAGWSAGETGSASTWLVSGTRGKARIHAEGSTQGAAWWQVCVQACAVACWCGRGAEMDEATWLSSTHFQKLYAYLKTDQSTARTKGGRRKLRLLACACCRLMLWRFPVRDCDRRAVEAAEAFADDRLDGAGLEAARGLFAVSWFSEVPGVQGASESMFETTSTQRVASIAYNVGFGALAVLPTEDRLANRQRLCDLVRDIFGNPFRPLARRAFPAHVIELARECYDTFPVISDRFLILADALADLGEEQAAEHCRQLEHARGCHVLDWILDRK